MRDDVRARDEGLRRLRSLTRGTVVAGLAALGVVSAAVAHAVPGRTHQQASTSGSAQGGSASESGSAVPAPGDSSLQPPAQAPAPAYSPPAAVSGGS